MSVKLACYTMIIKKDAIQRIFKNNGGEEEFRHIWKIEELIENFPDMISEDEYLYAWSCGMNPIDANTDREKLEEQGFVEWSDYAIIGQLLGNCGVVKWLEDDKAGESVRFKI